MAASDKVFDLLHRLPVIVYSALPPNLKDFEAALADEVVVFTSASEGFSQNRINCSISESLKRFEPVMAAASQHGLNVRGLYFLHHGMPYDGHMSPANQR